MVIKCTHCKGLMRIDEQRIPADGGVKVRCPHCTEIGYVPAAGLGAGRETHSLSAGQPVSSPVPRTPPEATRSAATEQMEKGDPTLPDDAFQDFRFPAEREAPEVRRTPVPRKKKLLVWAVVSLAIVAFFALLVNLVLPGPGGTRPLGGALSSGQPQVPQPPPGR